MNPVAMAVIILSLVGAFLWSAHNRWGLLRVGDRTHESRFAEVSRRLGAVWTFAFFQKKMRYYLAAGLAHQLIFLGFAILLLRTLILWGRGFDPGFNLWLFGPEQTLGQVYSFLKDVVAVLVLSGVSVFVYYRVIRPQQRMTLGWEGLLILGIIATMMLSDILYDGAALVLNQRYASECLDNPGALCRQVATVIAPLGAAESISWHPYPEPAGSLAAVAVAGVGTEALLVIAHAGFWTHSTLVLVFLNILPYSKHFHIITAVPNVFLSDLSHPGRLRPIAKNTEELMAMVEKATEREDMSIARIGYARIEHFSWKDVLDFYTCTECGRCSDNCPAHTTGKILSPKHLTLDLRDHLYARQEEFLELGQPPRLDLAPPAAEGAEAPADSTSSDEQSAAEAGGEQAEAKPAYQPVDLVPNVVHPDVLWACTTCRACEEQCPVMITYVDKIVQMRRNLVIIKGEFPGELSKPFEGMEVNGNPWNLSRMDRATWTEGLEIKTFSEKPDAEVLYWVGCAASYDDRAKKVARATAELLTLAGVDFAILGEEETCTGDPARRAGNEYLFTMLAEANIATIDGYKEQGGVKTVLTTCPHCFNTLLNEYPDFGGKYEVVHHTDYLLGLVAQKKLSPKTAVKARVAYHDSCYLGRYNDVYESPRSLLASIPGVELVEVDYWTRNKGLCCGAGGAQMWMEEQNKDRVNVKRIKQLMDTGATTVASACPFCMTMLTDGIKNESKEESVKNLDVVELLAVACGVGEARAADEPSESEPKSDGEAASEPTPDDAEAEQQKVEERDAEPA